jgi:hypothetical protein
MPFDCAKFYLSLTGSDYDRANVLRRRDVSDGAAEHAPTTVARNELELCILDWVHHTIAFDLRFGKILLYVFFLLVFLIVSFFSSTENSSTSDTSCQGFIATMVG